MHVTKEGIDRLKVANPLEVILADRGIELRKKGRVLVARCPFHEEKTASFTVTSSKGLYHCFGCGARGDVFGFITKRDKVGFPRAMEILARRAGLDLKGLMSERPTPHVNGMARGQTGALNGHGHEAPQIEMAAVDSSTSRRLLASVVEHYHRTFCERPDAQDYLKSRGLVDADLLKAWKVGYSDGSLLKTIPKSGEVRDGLVALGVMTAEGRELMGGCVVFPLPDPLSAAWINLYGRGVKSGRHCYLPGPLRGVFNFQAARTAEEVILTESVIDACSFHQAGVRNSIPLYGINGFTSDHLDLLKREGVKRVLIALDNDEAGHRATDSIKERLTAAGIEVRAVEWPEGVKDANEVLVSWSAELLREVASGARQVESLDGGQGEDVTGVGSFHLTDSVPRGEASALPQGQAGALPQGQAGALDASTSSATDDAAPAASSTVPVPSSKDGSILLSRHGLDFSARVQSTLLGRLRVTVKVSRGDSFHVDSIDLYASRARSEFAKKVEKVLSAEAAQVESVLLSLVVECERVSEADAGDVAAAQPEPMTESERREALAFLKRPDLLDEVGRDMDALGYVGEASTKILGYLISVSRKSDDPCSAIVISQSGAGKSALTEVIEKLTPPEDVVLFTRLTPQSLYYTEPGFLDHKLIMIEERNGSMEADYSIRVLQSRKKLIAAVPIKDPATGNLRTKIFTVEARAAFIEATTAGAVNHENATRCFELSMDESPAQTQRIHERQRVMRMEAGHGLRKQGEAISRKHWNAQRLLDPLPVVIPYADQITFPSSWMRTRRDHARFLNLIEVSAFLHQYQRERRSGAIVASVADYAVAYSLAGEVLKDTLQDLKKPLRDTFEQIRILASKSEGALTRSAIREALALPDSTVRRWLAELVELEYLETETVKQGKAARYVLTGRIPQENLALGLLSPEDLAQKLSNFATSPNFAKAVWRT